MTEHDIYRLWQSGGLNALWLAAIIMNNLSSVWQDSTLQYDHMYNVQYS